MNDTLDEYRSPVDELRYEMWCECRKRGLLVQLPKTMKKKKPIDIPVSTYYKILWKHSDTKTPHKKRK